MATYSVHKVTAVPGTYGANEIYLVADSGDVNLLEIYVTNNAGDAIRHALTSADVDAKITAAISAAEGAIVADDIPARNAIPSPRDGLRVLVVDATADPTVDSGGAEYRYRLTDTTWVKISETESMDLIFDWAGLTGKPTSSSAAIDTAVANSHTHANKTQLDLIGQDADGAFTYNGQNPDARLVTAAW